MEQITGKVKWFSITWGLNSQQKYGQNNLYYDVNSLSTSVIEKFSRAAGVESEAPEQIRNGFHFLFVNDNLQNASSSFRFLAIEAQLKTSGNNWKAIYIFSHDVSFFFFLVRTTRKCENTAICAFFCYVRFFFLLLENSNDIATKLNSKPSLYRNFVSPQIKDEKEGWQKELPFNDEKRLQVCYS